jgi:spore germination protein YaaH
MTKHFDYFINSTGDVQRHQVWFDDAETLTVKYRAAADHGARGIAMWTANMGDDAMWGALRQFKVM